ncbi:MAG TPA: hypothetical protein GXZ30_12575 [Propionibacterium sp.]|jgi:putative FmdB family regulatory protein|nr:hypothetical protein [Propionibacterium sp.]
MPTYQYRCRDCAADLEVVQKFTDDPLTECPSCDGGQLRKVFSAVGVVFKGSGFYRTDSRASDTKASSGSGSSTEAKPASGAESAKSTSASSSSSATPAAS